jgi:hypothetical protein
VPRKPEAGGALVAHPDGFEGLGAVEVLLAPDDPAVPTRVAGTPGLAQRAGSLLQNADAF